ncbi:MAG: D-2-hydroxyacid dehydrogenase [Alphaproteobacteria bacterium]|nr:D-2-hydroxyacid dehydrogenase [Alphaproteobacteria bacterium]
MKAVLMTYRRDDAHLQLGKDFPEFDLQVAWSANEMAAAIPGASILLLNNRICTPELGEVIRKKGSGVRWIQFISSGIELGWEMGLPDGVPVTNAAGVKGTVIGEHVMTMLLALARRVPEFVEARKRREWIRTQIHSQMWSAEGKTLVVVGMGSIGREVARKAKAFDLHVIGVSRAGQADSNFDEVLPRTELHRALARADAVVISMPSDADTYHFIGEDEFAAMRPTAFLVNVARGEIVDEKALIKALRSRQIAGAALDVTDPEPPIEDSPLWTLDNVLISPHVSGGGSTGYERFRALFADNLARFQTGQPLRNLLTPPDRRIRA